MPKLAGMEQCTGCSACIAACPISCIKMVRDEEGFLQPVVGSECVGCGKCELACPIINGAAGHSADGQMALAAVTGDECVWRNSSSGGAFSCLCEAFAAEKQNAETVVYGAAMDFPNVKHIRCSSDDIAPLRKSKYVQSDKGLTFRQVKDDLKAGRRVIFSGTPCEIAGISSYLGALSNSESLLLVDFICHGAGSPSVFEACMGKASSEMGEVVDYGFRCKRPIAGNYERYLSMYKYLDKNSSIKLKYVRMDDYNRLFLNQACLRRSCMERCHFRDRKRYSDVTLADCNGKSVLYPEHDDGRGWSTVVGNTKKGRALMMQLSTMMSVFPTTPDDVARFNPLFDHTTPGNPRRNLFFQRFLSGDDLGYLVDEFGVPKSIKTDILIHIPRRIKKVAKRFLAAVRG